MLSDSDVTGKRLLILDGTTIGKEIVLHAQRMGVLAVVADYNSVENAPAKQVADEHVLVSITDVDAVVDVIERFKIDGVVAGFSDMILPYYAEICERAGVPAYGTIEQFRAFTDKSVYKAICRAHGVPVVEGYALEDFSESATTKVQYPVIVKPARGSGSRGITVCRDSVAVRQAVAGMSTEEAENVVIEQFLEGDEATVFWLFGNGEFKVSMFANRHVVRYDEMSPPLPFAYTSPCAAYSRYSVEIAPAVRQMLRTMGVRDGMMFMQGIFDSNGVFRTYDIGFRVTGTQEYRLLEAMTGLNPLDMLINYSLTGRMQPANWSESIDASRLPYCFNVSVSMNPGTVSKLTGLEEVRKMAGVVSVIPTRKSGDTLPEEARGQLRQIAVRVLGVAQTEGQLLKMISTIRRKIRVVGTRSEDLTLDAPTVDVSGRLM